MSLLKFGTQFLGTELVSIRPHTRRLVHQDYPLLGSDRPHVEDSSPNWAWNIVAKVYTVQTDIDTMNAYLTTLKAYFDAAGKQTLLVRNDADDTTIATYTNCRCDAMEAPELRDIPEQRRGIITFRFSTASDGT